MRAIDFNSASADFYNMSLSDYKHKLREEALDVLVDAHGEGNFSEDEITDQAVASVFGELYKDNGEKYTLDEAARMYMCDTIGHPNVEQLMWARDIVKEARSLQLEVRTVGGTVEVLCRRCNCWFTV